MNWKDIFGLIQNIVGIVPTFYYGFRHYVMDEDHYEWEKRDDGEKIFFYLVTSPIWLIVGLFELLGWIVDKINATESSSNALVVKNIKENISPNPQNDSFLLVVHDVFQIKGRGPAVSGTVAKGKISKGDKLIITGVGETYKAICIGIEHNRQLVKSAEAGELVGILLKGVNFHDLHVGQSVTK